MAVSESVLVDAQRVTIKGLEGLDTYVGIRFTITPQNTVPILVGRDMFYVSIGFEEEGEWVTITQVIATNIIVKTQPIIVIYYPKNVFTSDVLPIKNQKAAIYYYPKEV